MVDNDGSVTIETAAELMQIEVRAIRQWSAIGAIAIERRDDAELVDLRQVQALVRTGVVMSSVTLAGFEGNLSTQVGAIGDASNREKVLGEGPKQTGGRRIEIPSTGAAPKALQQIASDLLGQYALTYSLPDGVKPDRRFSASVKRKGLTLRAPYAIPDE